MGLRGYQDQTATEDFNASLSAQQREAERVAWTIPKQEVCDEAECRLHVAVKGTYCQKFAGAFYVCKGRRLAVAYARAGLSFP